MRPPLARASFDLIWSSDTVNHLRAPFECVRALAALLKPGGRLVLVQSSFLADMFFA
jgi:2-polyprenyl-3-methyl-5-hydroxy-6-metoxy-1,4-benzoquinol methylase